MLRSGVRAASPRAAGSAAPTPPIEVQEIGEDSIRATGLLPGVLQSCLGDLWQRATGFVHACSCVLKTAVVPAHDLNGWAEYLRASPMGSRAVQRSWPYLGVAIAGRAVERQEMVTAWTRGSLRAIQDETWQRALAKGGARAQTIGGTKASPADKAAAWNTYVTSLVYYPANLAPCSSRVSAAWNRMLNAAFGRPRWAPPEALTALGPSVGVAGGPKHPGTLAAATHLRRWLTSATWGPAGLSRGMDSLQRLGPTRMTRGGRTRGLPSFGNWSGV